mgnify:CR=1 FL=1
MSKDKNFSINRVKERNGISAGDIKIGDVFEREGSLHMRVTPHVGTPSGKITICNLNTGSVWCVSTDERFIEAHNCVIDYSINLHGAN